MNLKTPKKAPEFKAYWDRFVDKLSKRDNFTEAHLVQLSILCDHLVNYDKCCNIIDKEGLTYQSEGRNGVQHKTHPAADLKIKYSTHIKDYCKLLDIKLAKDTNINPGENGADDGWE